MEKQTSKTLFELQQGEAYVVHVKRKSLQKIFLGHKFVYLGKVQNQFLFNAMGEMVSIEYNEITNECFITFQDSQKNFTVSLPQISFKVTTKVEILTNHDIEKLQENQWYKIETTDQKLTLKLRSKLFKLNHIFDFEGQLGQRGVGAELQSKQKEKFIIIQLEDDNKSVLVQYDNENIPFFTIEAPAVFFAAMEDAPQRTGFMRRAFSKMLRPHSAASSKLRPGARTWQFHC